LLKAAANWDKMMNLALVVLVVQAAAALVGD